MSYQDLFGCVLFLILEFFFVEHYTGREIIKKKGY